MTVSRWLFLRLLGLVYACAFASLAPQIVRKGSIAVDGISLTVAERHDDGFSVALIPETLERTNLGVAQPGATVNLEVDVLAKYVEQLVEHAG